MAAAAFGERLTEMALAMPQMCAALHLLDAGAPLVPPVPWQLLNTCHLAWALQHAASALSWSSGDSSHSPKVHVQGLLCRLLCLIFISPGGWIDVLHPFIHCSCWHAHTPG